MDNILINYKNSKTSNLYRLLLNQLQRGIINLNYLMDHIFYHIFNIMFEYIFKNHKKVTGNPPIRLCVNKMENIITFKIKTESIVPNF